MDSNDIGRAVRRIAHEILERTDDRSQLVILGIPTRGVSIAHRLAGALDSLDARTPVGVLDITAYRDDRRGAGSTAPSQTTCPVAVTDRTVILVDDVLYTGRTIRAALDAIVDLGRPARVQVAVLIDRGHRELPIRADYVGKNVPTARDERVAVRVEEVDGRDDVRINAATQALTGGGR